MELQKTVEAPEKFKNMTLAELCDAVENPERYGIGIADLIAFARFIYEFEQHIEGR